MEPLDKRGIYSNSILLFMCFSCFLILSTQRINMGIAIVPMVNWTSLEESTNFSCGYNTSVYSKSIRESESGKYEWPFFTQSLILSSYFIGLAAAYVPAEVLVKKVNPKWVSFAGTLIASVCTLLTPLAASLGPYYLMTFQFLKGIGQAVIFPAFGRMLTIWLSGDITVDFLAFAATGITIGSFSTLFTAGIISEHKSYGWQCIFYFTGSLGILWCLYWFYLISGYFYPTLLIFRSEPKAKRNEKNSRLSGWLVLRSGSFWAYVTVGIATFCAFGFNILLLPSYLRKAYGINIQMNSYVTSIPQLLQGFFFLVSYLLIDRMVKRCYRNFTRKVCLMLGLSLFTALSIALTFTDCETDVSLVIIAVSYGIIGLNMAALASIPFDLSTKFADRISCIMNTLGALASAGYIIMFGYFVEVEHPLKNHNQSHWHRMQVAMILFNAVAIILYLAFGTCEIQPWDSFGKV